MNSSFVHVCGYQLERMAWRKTACIAATRARGTWCRGQHVYIQITSQWIYTVHWLNILTFNTEWCRPQLLAVTSFASTPVKSVCIWSVNFTLWWPCLENLLYVHVPLWSALKQTLAKLPHQLKGQRSCIILYNRLSVWEQGEWSGCRTLSLNHDYVEHYLHFLHRAHYDASWSTYFTVQQHKQNN